MNYTNPRLEAVIPDWPSGKFRTTATFRVETSPRGYRVTRTTVDPKTGKTCAPKATTYARAAQIVDGDDGRTYVFLLTMYDFISVMQGNLQFQQEAIFDTDPRYTALRSLLQGKPT